VYTLVIFTTFICNVYILDGYLLSVFVNCSVEVPPKMEGCIKKRMFHEYGSVRVFHTKCRHEEGLRNSKSRWTRTHGMLKTCSMFHI
jgi:hypothetical protein